MKIGYATFCIEVIYSDELGSLQFKVCALERWSLVSFELKVSLDIIQHKDQCSAFYILLIVTDIVYPHIVTNLEFLFEGSQRI